VGVGIDHVGNYFLLSKAENEYFGSRGEIWKFKIDNIGSIAKHAAMALQTHIHTQLRGRGGDATRNLNVFRCDMLSVDRVCIIIPYALTPNLFVALEQLENSHMAFKCTRQRRVDLFS
jgi:hypothetical protein